MTLEIQEYVFPCCDQMFQMITKFLIQWKQKYSIEKAGFYFCCNDAARAAQDAHTNTRKGTPLLYCPFCAKELPKIQPRIFRIKG